MDRIHLILKYFNYKTIELCLDRNIKIFDMSNIPEYLKTTVCMNYKYTLSLKEELSDIKGISFYLNNKIIDMKYDDNMFHTDIQYLFPDIFGFAQISVDIEYQDNRIESYFSEFFNVGTNDNSLVTDIKRIFSYIYKNQELLLYDKNTDSTNLSSLKNNNKSTLESQLYLVKKIIKTYADNYNYLKNNKKVKLTKESSIDSFEKLNYVNQQTLSFIVSHPEELIAFDKKSSISYENNYYIPNRTLITENKQSSNIYENRILISFLFTILKYLEDIETKIKKNLVSNSDLLFEKESSASIIYNISTQKLKVLLNDIVINKKRVKDLLLNYNRIFLIEYSIINTMPKPTQTFLSVRGYSDIYILIKEWMSFGIYNLDAELLLVPFLTNSQVYEYYVLLKICNYFTEKGFKLDKKERYLYKPPNTTRYSNTSFSNTFYFRQRDVEVCVYYQPVIYTKPNSKNNNINILRNNKLALDKNLEVSGGYYLPDFIIKIKKNDNVEYLILDAKFSTMRSVKNYYFPILVYKYIFSLSVTKLNEKIIGICAINGKREENASDNYSIYTEYVNKDILPIANIATILETSEDPETNKENHKSIFDSLLSDIIK